MKTYFPHRWFSGTIAAFGLLLGAMVWAADPPPDTTRIVGVHRVPANRTEAVRKIYLEEARAALDRISAARQAGQEPAAADLASAARVAAAIYEAGGDDSPSILKSLLKQQTEGGKTVLSAEHGQALWEVRNEWFFRAAERIAAREKIDIGFLDSGTEGSVASDTDKTHRILKRHGEQPSQFTEARLSAAIQAEVTNMIKEETGRKVGLAALDVEVFSGQNFYPGWWVATEPALFKKEALRVLSELEKQPAAYITDAAQKAQVIRRALEKAKALAAALAGGSEWVPGAAFVRVAYDPATGKCTREQPADWLDLLQLSGEVFAQDPFGSALGNMLMLRHKLEHREPGKSAAQNADAVKDDFAKYLMRCVLDTATFLTPDKVKALERFEPGDFKDEASRREILARAINLKADAQDPALADGVLAFEISQDLLASKKLRAAGKPTKSDDEIFRRLAERQAGSAENYRKDPARWQEAARVGYGELAAATAERVLTSNFPKAVETWLSPDRALVERAARYGTKQFSNQNIRIAAMVLLKAAHDNLQRGDEAARQHGFELWQKLVANAKPEQQVDLENLHRMLSWGVPSSKPPVPAPAAAEAEDPSRLRQAAEAAAERLRVCFDALRVRFPVTTPEGRLFSVTSDDVWKWTLNRSLAPLGIVEKSAVVDVLGRVEREAGRYFDPKEMLKGIAEVGTADSFMSCLRAWQQSEGQPPEKRREALRDAAVDELVGRIPLFGGARGVYRAYLAADANAMMEQLAPLAEAELVKLGAEGMGAAGPAILYVNLSKKLVQALGHEIFHPLRKDYMDIVYKGYLEPSEAGLLRAGRKVPGGYLPQLFPSLLSRLPLRFAYLEGELLEKLTTELDQSTTKEDRQAFIALTKEMEKAGTEAPMVLVDLTAPYDTLLPKLREEIQDLARPSPAGEAQATREEMVDALVRVEREWSNQAALVRALRDRLKSHTPWDFEARRQNVYARFREQVAAVFREREARGLSSEDLLRQMDEEQRKLRLELWNLRGATLEEVTRQRAALEASRRDIEERITAIHAAEREAVEQVALRYVESWVRATGDFKGDDENAALDWVFHDEETRRGVAAKLADDYAASRKLTPAAEATLGSLSSLRESALEKAASRRARRLAIAAERLMPTPDPEDFRTWALALARPPAIKPKVDVRLVIVESRNEDGSKHEELQVESRCSGLPAQLGETWAVSGPKVSKVTGLPPQEMRRLTKEKADEAYEVKVDLLAQPPADAPSGGETSDFKRAPAVADTGVPAGLVTVASGQTYFGLRPKIPETPASRTLVQASAKLNIARQRSGDAVWPPMQQILATDGVKFFADVQLTPPQDIQNMEEVHYRFEIMSGGKRVANETFGPGLPFTAGSGGYVDLDPRPNFPDEQYPFSFPHTAKSFTREVGSSYSMGDRRFLSLLRAGQRSFDARLTLFSYDAQGKEIVLAESSASFQVDYRRFAPKALKPQRGFESLVGRKGPGVSVAKCELAGTNAHVRLVERNAQLAEIASLDTTLELPEWVDQGDNQGGDRYVKFKVRLEGQPSKYDARGMTAENGVVRGLYSLSSRVLTPADPELSGRFGLSCNTDRKANKIENPSFTIGLQLTGQRFLFDVVFDETGGGGGGGGGDTSTGTPKPNPPKPNPPSRSKGEGDDSSSIPPRDKPLPTSPPRANDPGAAALVPPGKASPEPKPVTSTAARPPASPAAVKPATGSSSPAPKPAAKPPAVPPTPEKILAAPKPWENPQVQTLIDEWLRVSKPIEEPGRAWRWNEWAQITDDRAVKITAPPDHPGQTRFEYLWNFGARARSVRHGTLREFIERRLKGQPGEVGPAAAPAVAKPPAPKPAAPAKPVPNLGGNWSMASFSSTLPVELHQNGRRVTGTATRSGKGATSTIEFDAMLDATGRTLRGELRTRDPAHPNPQITAFELTVNSDTTEASGPSWLARDSRDAVYERGQELPNGQTNEFRLALKRR